MQDPLLGKLFIGLGNRLLEFIDAALQFIDFSNTHINIII